MPAERQAAEAALAKKEMAAVTARQAVETAELELATTPAGDRAKRLAARQKVRLKQLEANAAYREAGWPAPYPDARP